MKKTFIAYTKSAFEGLEGDRTLLDIRPKLTRSLCEVIDVTLRTNISVEDAGIVLGLFQVVVEAAKAMIQQLKRRDSLISVWTVIQDPFRRICL